MTRRTETYIHEALEIKDVILYNYEDLLNNPSRKGYIDVLKGINDETIHVADFKVPGWRSSERLIQLNTPKRSQRDG